jgi:hypothetical protein
MSRITVTVNWRTTGIYRSKFVDVNRLTESIAFCTAYFKKHKRRVMPSTERFWRWFGLCDSADIIGISWLKWMQILLLSHVKEILETTDNTESGAPNLVLRLPIISPSLDTSLVKWTIKFGLVLRHPWLSRCFHGRLFAFAIIRFQFLIDRPPIFITIGCYTTLSFTGQLGCQCEVCPGQVLVILHLGGKITLFSQSQRSPDV